MTEAIKIYRANGHDFTMYTTPNCQVWLAIILNYHTRPDPNFVKYLTEVFGPDRVLADPQQRYCAVRFDGYDDKDQIYQMVLASLNAKPAYVTVQYQALWACQA